MIYDSLSNMDFYKGLSSDIFESLTFLKQVSADFATGVYEILPRVKAIVSEYETKEHNECIFEAHKKFVDIHYALKGQERVAYSPIEKMKETKAYDEQDDVAIFEGNAQPLEMTIGNGYFAIFFPQDGHLPEFCVDEPAIVKKVVMKVLV